MKINCQYNDLIDVDLLTPHPRNSNTHGEKQIKMLAKIIDHTGWRHPIIVSSRSKFIVAGHGRLEAAKLNGYKEVPVQYQDFNSEAAEFEFLIADNKIAELADHDDALMIENIKDLDLGDIDFELLGLDDFNIDGFSKEIKNTSGELDLDSFDNFQHTCPKCGFEWDDSGKDNS